MEIIANAWTDVYRSLLNPGVDEVVLVLHGSKLHVSQFVATPYEGRRFAAVLEIMVYLAHNLPTNTITTKRDFYYQDTLLFGNQRFLDSIIDTVATSLRTQSTNLLIYPGQKGLMYGSQELKVHVCVRPDGKLKTGTMAVSFKGAPVLIPNIPLGSEIRFSRAPRLIIVIEKEATFLSFCTFLESVNHNYLVITGKGFPDKLTRRFVSLVAAHCPIAVFVDSDVYGINILHSYQRSLGYHFPIIFAGVFLLDYSEGWQPISTRDFRMSLCTLQRLVTLARSTPDSRLLWAVLHRELTRGMFLHKKSEMNVLDEDNAYLWSQSRRISDHTGPHERLSPT